MIVQPEEERREGRICYSLSECLLECFYYRKADEKRCSRPLGQKGKKDAKEVACVVGRTPRLLPPHTPCSASQFQCCGLNWRHLARWPGLEAIGAPSGERPCCPTLTRLSNKRVRLRQAPSRDGQG